MYVVTPLGSLGIGTLLISCRNVVCECRERACPFHLLKYWFIDGTMAELQFKFYEFALFGSVMANGTAGKGKPFPYSEGRGLNHITINFRLP